MSEAAYVEEAALIARSLLAKESRGPGDTENAMRRLEARYGIPFHALWSLRYRKPKGIFCGLYARILAARDAEIARQQRLLALEAELAAKRMGLSHPIVRDAAALAMGSNDVVEEADTG